ncbi:PQQ-like beta-propeller repeat protein [Myxococcota bacterium]|nr:PQQ-like beta-propeller repeat protein [Myxococcota bacterium]
MSTEHASRVERPLVAAWSGRVFGVDRATGEVLWEHELDTAGNATALIVTDTHVFAATFRELAALRYPTGELLWTISTTAIGRATLLLDGDHLFVAKSGELECVSTAGRWLWHERFAGKGAGYAALGVPGNVAQADES